MFKSSLFLLCTAGFISCTFDSLLSVKLYASTVDYDIVYCRSPRLGDETRVPFPEVANPMDILPGTDLMLLHPDGSEEILVPGGNGAIIDPYVSFDGLWVYYSKLHDQRPEALDNQRLGDPSRAGADIFKINLQTREIIQLTFQEWTPNTGLVNWSSNHLNNDDGDYYLGYGIFNLGPCPLPDGRVMFTSSRKSYLPNKSFTSINLQLFVMDNDGTNVELIGHMNLGSALHPTILMDGRVMFSSYESQGLRDKRVWGLWSIWPDGRYWEPLKSAFSAPTSFHFQTQLSNGDIAVVAYYNFNNNGFGTILGFPAEKDLTKPNFGSPTAKDPSNPLQELKRWNSDDGSEYTKSKQYRFSPQGLYTLTPFAHEADNASATDPSGNWMGKVTHPSSAPDNDLLLVWTPGPANDKTRPVNLPTYDAGIYILKGGIPVDTSDELELIKNDPNYNELQPRPVVSYKAIYGIDEPVNLSWYKNDGTLHEGLEPGTPFGLTGTSSFYKRDTTPEEGAEAFDGLDPFNTSKNGISTNWFVQGADAGKYSNSDIYAVRILSMEAASHVSRGPGIGKAIVRGFYSHSNERLRILGEVLLRKKDASGEVILDPEGNPDTSYLAKIPADTPFTFQTLDKDGLVLNMSQTWHQLRPGEVRNDCGGCHGHSQLPLDFNLTKAADRSYIIPDLTKTTPLLTKSEDGDLTTVFNDPNSAVDVEYYRDIKPILQRSCVGCHSMNGTAEAQLVLDDETIVDGYENTYNRLARDEDGDYGIPSVINNGRWRQSNASRYIRKFQSRRSLLVWKVFGRRLDGWSNSDHPTESIPGDASTLPSGANPDLADIDYTGTIMPPLNSGYPPLSNDEKMLFARWIDLGAPITSPEPGVKQQMGWFADEKTPIVDISLPERGRQSNPVSQIRFGAFDYYSGLDRSSFSVTANFNVSSLTQGSIPAGSELFPYFVETGDHVWTLDLDEPIEELNNGEITISVKDNSGNILTSKRNFHVGTEPAQASLEVTKVGLDQVNLNLTGEQSNQFMLESSNDLINWYPLLKILDFDGAQNFIYPIQPQTDKVFYRTNRIEK